MTLSQISTPLSKEQAYALVDAVMANDELAITASAHEDEATGEWIFEATCTEEPDIAAFTALEKRVPLVGYVASSGADILAGIGGMSEFSMMTQGVAWPLAYGAFMAVMMLVGGGTFLALRYFERKTAASQSKRPALS